MTLQAATQDKKALVLEKVAMHLLAHGFAESGIRTLADAAGISDRMLIYYFKTKETLITEALAALGAGLAAQLDALLPVRTASRRQIVDTMTEAGDHPDVQPILKLWFELVGLSMRGQEPYRSACAQMLAGWEAWIAEKLGSKRAHLAPEVLAQVEGALMVKLLRSPP